MKNKGFTLIELLVVIAIIGFLATIVLYSLDTIKAKSRDSRRATDINAIQEGLSMYYNDNFLYPNSGGGAIEINGVNDDMSAALIGSEVMSGVPVDPLNKDSYKYYYRSFDEETDYEITYYLETNSIQNRFQGLNVAKP